MFGCRIQMHIVKCQYEDWKIIPTDLANNIFAKNTLKEVSFAFSLNDWGDFCLMKEREAAESKRREQKDEKAADNAGRAPQGPFEMHVQFLRDHY